MGFLAEILNLRKILITTVPFGEFDSSPLEMLNGCEGLEIKLNPLGRRITESELCDLIDGVEILIAGTEPITRAVISKAKQLRHISRVGIGLDNVDLLCCEERDISVSYTPEAPSESVAELTLGLIIDVLRGVSVANDSMRSGNWRRLSGNLLKDTTIGVLGYGRIGSKVCDHLLSLGVKGILVNDLRKGLRSSDEKLRYVSKDFLYENADVLTLHVPLTGQTLGMISANVFEKLKKDVKIINTARGGVVDEDALISFLRSNRQACAAVDVFAHEPYLGPLMSLDNCVLTCHMGSMSYASRRQMELEAVQDAIRFLSGQPLVNRVPRDEYMIQKKKASCE